MCRRLTAPGSPTTTSREWPSRIPRDPRTFRFVTVTQAQFAADEVVVSHDMTMRPQKRRNIRVASPRGDESAVAGLITDYSVACLAS